MVVPLPHLNQTQQVPNKIPHLPLIYKNPPLLAKLNQGIEIIRLDLRLELRLPQAILNQILIIQFHPQLEVKVQERDGMTLSRELIHHHLQ